ncbi:hypothetical protein [Sphingomonas sp.]|uniref:hypothetical protein n=1 Tax=Sphingomonas sp. TaxID=28214 RepID=UPI00183321A8|nr:hypothetical protein [Sphingomonas sp.]MBA3510395.1 hypothetical protein [Sphingomonas sp.]
MLTKALTLVGSPIELLGKLPVDPGKVNPVSGFGSAALFTRSRAVVFGIVRHGGKTSANPVRSVAPSQNLLARQAR